MTHRKLLPFATFSALLLCLLLVGCVPLPYVYPLLSYVPSTVVPPINGRVYAFRVESVETCSGDSILDWKFSEKFSPVAVEDGATVSQVQLSLEAGCYWPGLRLVGENALRWHHGENLEVRLYKPGYPVLKFRAWELFAGSDLGWSATPDLASQESVLDELTSRGKDGPNKSAVWSPGSRSVAPGSVSRKHRQCLLFFGSEYERLATLERGEGTEAALRHTRLLRKAREMKELAEK